MLTERARKAEFVELLLEDGLSAAGLSTVDRAFCRELVFGVVRWQAALDELISRKASRGKPPAEVRDILRLGLYQLFWLERVPDHAVLNESVELTRAAGFGRQSGFVNAVLRGYARERVETEALLEELRNSTPAIGWSHPDWLVEKWQRQFGETTTNALLEWNNKPPPAFARVNTLRVDAARLLESWRLKEDVSYDLVTRDWLPENLIFELKQHAPLPSLESFRNGWFYVQDPSTVLAATIVNPQAGESILDFCAAPGGKTTLIAQLAADKARIWAQDLSTSRLKLLRENCHRLGVSSIARIFMANDREAIVGSERFDKVLVDAPCSNTGVMRRRVDLRWRIKSEVLQQLGDTQLTLLQQAADFVKPNGRLIYSTCSLEPEENCQLIERFLQSRDGFSLDYERQLTPQIDRVDGAYVAAMTNAG